MVEFSVLRMLVLGTPVALFGTVVDLLLRPWVPEGFYDLLSGAFSVISVATGCYIPNSLNLRR